MDLLSGPLEESEGQTGFHDTCENDIDDFEEEYELHCVLRKYLLYANSES